jgi:hypothetical protein
MASSTAPPRIVELAAQISTSVTQLQEQLSAQGAPTPSFDEDGDELLPKNVFHLKGAILDATADPRDSLGPHSTALQVRSRESAHHHSLLPRN